MKKNFSQGQQDEKKDDKFLGPNFFLEIQDF